MEPNLGSTYLYKIYAYRRLVHLEYPNANFHLEGLFSIFGFQSEFYFVFVFVSYCLDVFFEFQVVEDGFLYHVRVVGGEKLCIIFVHMLIRLHLFQRNNNGNSFLVTTSPTVAHSLLGVGLALLKSL